MGNYVGVFILLGANLYLVQINSTFALAFFFACGGLFLEQRKRKMATVSIKTTMKSIDGTSLAPVSNLSVKADDLIEGEIHPEYDEPAGNRYTYDPKVENQSNKFEEVGESINQKHILDTEESTSGLFR